MKNRNTKRIENAFRALAVGDAMGKICSKYSREDILRIYGGMVSELVKPIREKSSKKWIKGSITDDTILTLLVADSLIENRRFVRADIGNKLIACLPMGGTQINKLKKSNNPHYVTKSGYTNGASLRISPIVFFEDNIEALSRNIINQSTLTHGHKEAITASLCVAYALFFVFHEVKGEFINFTKIHLKKYYPLSLRTKTFRNLIHAFDLTNGRDDVCDVLESQIGFRKYSWSSVPAAIVIGMRKRATQDVFLDIIHRNKRGGDLDTVASIAGSIMGLTSIDEWTLATSREIERIHSLDFKKYARDLLIVKKNKITTIVFDLWGTLIYLPKGWRAFNFLKEKFSISKSAWISIVKPLFLCKAQKSPKTYLADFRKTTGLPVDSKKYYFKMANFLSADLRSIRTYGDVENSLRTLRKEGYSLGILSNQASLYDRAFHRLDFARYFDFKVFSYVARARKPDIKIYKKLIQAAKEKKEKILMIGNSIKDDYLGARNAGIESILIKRGGGNMAPEIKTIRTLADII